MGLVLLRLGSPSLPEQREVGLADKAGRAPLTVVAGSRHQLGTHTFCKLTCYVVLRGNIL